MVFAGNLTQLEGSFKVGPAIILIAMLATFVLVGFFSRAKDTTDYYAAGRKISNISSGMAIGSNWMSAASFLGMAGMMYATGYNGLAYVVGWTGGYVLLLVLMAGQIRKYGKFTAPDFIGDRYYSQLLRGDKCCFYHSDIFCILCRTVWRSRINVQMDTWNRLFMGSYHRGIGSYRIYNAFRYDRGNKEYGYSVYYTDHRIPDPDFPFDL